jgi:hypothetical protein
LAFTDGNATTPPHFRNTEATDRATFPSQQARIPGHPVLGPFADGPASGLRLAREAGAHFLTELREIVGWGLLRASLNERGVRAPICVTHDR